MPSLPAYIAKHNRRPILLERFLHSSLLCSVLQGLVVCISGARTRRIIRLLRSAPTTVQNFKQSVEIKIEKRMELACEMASGHIRGGMSQDFETCYKEFRCEEFCKFTKCRAYVANNEPDVQVRWHMPSGSVLNQLFSMALPN
jgi:hypothetical protein